MSTEQAQSAVSLSAFVVAVIFAYRKLVENPLGAGSSKTPVPTTGHFVIGFGFTYIMLSLFAQAAPTFGGMMAVLVGVGDVLVNGQPLIDDVTAGLKATQTATTPPRAQPGISVPTAAAIAAAAPAPGLGTAGLAHGAGTITPGQ